MFLTAAEMPPALAKSSVRMFEETLDDDWFGDDGFDCNCTLREADEVPLLGGVDWELLLLLLALPSTAGGTERPRRRGMVVIVLKVVVM